MNEIEKAVIQAVAKTEPDVRFDGRRGLVLIDKWSEHRLFNPNLEAMLQRYLTEPESRPSVRKWIDETRPDSLFGFVALCEYLDLDAGYVRRGLTRWMDNIDRGRLGHDKAQERVSDWPGFDPRVTRKIEPLREC